MTKLTTGLVLGGILGLVDGLAAFRTPQVADMMAAIVLGSTTKGVVSGLAAGAFARSVRSVPAGVAFGLLVGLVLAFIAAWATPDSAGHRYYFSIMLPGAVLGAVVGFATQRFGGPDTQRRPK
ncbi:MAG: hypothetical protein HYY06_28535 [Deltaproteobacteria bacterium]|nr:hypothetical protein [Deltaproteobacteria bacterium]